jgi:hypothetical protein
MEKKINVNKIILENEGINRMINQMRQNPNSNSNSNSDWNNNNTTHIRSTPPESNIDKYIKDNINNIKDEAASRVRLLPEFVNFTGNKPEKNTYKNDKKLISKENKQRYDNDLSLYQETKLKFDDAVKNMEKIVEKEWRENWEKKKIEEEEKKNEQKDFIEQREYIQSTPEYEALKNIREMEIEVGRIKAAFKLAHVHNRNIDGISKQLQIAIKNYEGSIINAKKLFDKSTQEFPKIYEDEYNKIQEEKKEAEKAARIAKEEEKKAAEEEAERIQEVEDRKVAERIAKEEEKKAAEEAERIQEVADRKVAEKIAEVVNIGKGINYVKVAFIIFFILILIGAGIFFALYYKNLL